MLISLFFLKTLKVKNMKNVSKRLINLCHNAKPVAIKSFKVGNHRDLILYFIMLICTALYLCRNYRNSKRLH
jgi:hypothetical protein